MEIKIEFKEWVSIKEMYKLRDNIDYMIHTNGLTEIIESITEKVR